MRTSISAVRISSRVSWRNIALAALTLRKIACYERDFIPQQAHGRVEIELFLRCRRPADIKQFISIDILDAVRTSIYASYKCCFHLFCFSFVMSPFDLLCTTKRLTSFPVKFRAGWVTLHRWFKLSKSFMAFCLSSAESLASNLAPRQIRALRGQSRLHNEFWTQRFFLRVCPLPLGSCDSLAGRTPSKGFFHKFFNTSCHSSPLMTRRVNFTSAKTVTHRMAMPMLKPKKISMMGIIRLWYHNH